MRLPSHNQVIVTTSGQPEIENLPSAEPIAHASPPHMGRKDKELSTDTDQIKSLVSKSNIVLPQGA